MKVKLFFAGTMFALVMSAHAQTLVERAFLLRTESTTFDSYSGMAHTCVLVYPDGKYRMERTFQGVAGNDPDTKVYLDSLPDADLKALQSVLDDNQFAGIQTERPHGGIVKDMDTLYVTVPREHTMQNITFNNAAERKPFDKSLKPFQNALKNLEKRKVAVAKGEKGNNCEAPRLLYRSDHPMAMPDSN
jgi:hypothetical protein